MESTSECFICRKHAGTEPAPPGGYLYEDPCFRVCHAPAALAAPGTLLVESRRHVLDFAAMTLEEAAGFGPLLALLYAAIKRAVGAERVYTLVTLEGAAHFHAWLVPRPVGVEARGARYLAEARSCTEGEAIAAAEAIRAELGHRPQQ